MNAIYAKRESTISIAVAFDEMQCWIKDTYEQAIDSVRAALKLNTRFRTIDRVLLSSLAFLAAPASCQQ